MQFARMNQREAGRLLAGMMRSDAFVFARERREDTFKLVDGNIGRVTLRGLHRTVPVGCRHISHSTDYATRCSLIGSNRRHCKWLYIVMVCSNEPIVVQVYNIAEWALFDN